METHHVSISGNELTVQNVVTGKLFARMFSTDIVAVSDSSDFGPVVVLLEAAQRDFQSNLLSLSEEGIDWVADLPSSDLQDAYVTFEFVGNALYANSWEGYRACIDIQTGKVLSKTFVK